MPIAAVPAYLGHDFSEASPGMRFGMYLPVWTARSDQETEVNERAEGRSPEARDVESMLHRHGMDGTIASLVQRKKLPGIWDKNDAGANAAWRQIAALSPRDKTLLESLANRQRAMAARLTPSSFRCFEAVSTAPFTTGLGNEHPLENGFAFLSPYGLPYLPGSGVKGVLRQAARELASGEWGDDPALWTAEAITSLFGSQAENGDDDHLRGALEFWDVVPQVTGDSLAVDIMTPHQSHYYQPPREASSSDSTTPHDSGRPNPIKFLTVPARSAFAFHVRCDLHRLERTSPGLAGNHRWAVLLETAFEHAYHWLGFGAKTAVGYGAMKDDAAARERADRRRRDIEAAEQRHQAELRRQEALTLMSPARREAQEYLDARVDRNQSELSALLSALKADRWTGETRTEIAEYVKSLMQEAKKWKEKSEKKNPGKDHDYQDTLKVIGWLKGP